MKTKQIVAILGCVGLAMAASATSVTFSFQENDVPPGMSTPLGTTSTFTEGGVSITANGFDSSGNPSDLFAKNTGIAGETGLGMVNDTTSATDHEIDNVHFIQLVLSNLKPTASCILTISSIQGTEGAVVYATTSTGVPTSADIIATLPGSAGVIQTVDITSYVNAGDLIDVQATSGNVLIETLFACITTTVSLSPPNPLPVCGSAGNQLTGPAGFTTYSWTLVNPSAGWAITSGANSQTVTYTAGPSGSAEFQLMVTDSNGCPGTGDVTVTCSAPPSQPLVHGDTATIGFWHNKNGQALINSVNGGSNATALGTWLASNFGCLFGNLNGAKNSAVANQFLTYFGGQGLEKTYAQIMGAALAAYVTDSTLAGGTMAAGYGFNVSSTGTGDKVFNVGSDGTAIGLLNNTDYTVMQLLDAANANCTGGVINPSALTALNDIFDGINQGGDIQ